MISHRLKIIYLDFLIKWMRELSHKLFPSRSFKKNVRIFSYSNSCVQILAVFLFHMEMINRDKHFQNSLFSMVIDSCHGKVQYCLKKLDDVTRILILYHHMSKADITVKSVTSKQA